MSIFKFIIYFIVFYFIFKIVRNLLIGNTKQFPGNNNHSTPNNPSKPKSNIEDGSLKWDAETVEFEEIKQKKE